MDKYSNIITVDDLEYISILARTIFWIVASVAASTAFVMWLW